MSLPVRWMPWTLRTMSWAWPRWRCLRRRQRTWRIRSGPGPPWPFPLLNDCEMQRNEVHERVSPPVGFTTLNARKTSTSTTPTQAVAIRQDGAMVQGRGHGVVHQVWSLRKVERWLQTESSPPKGNVTLCKAHPTHFITYKDVYVHDYVDR